MDSRMNGYEFERRVRKLAHEKRVEVLFTNHGKGSHGRLYYGGRFTTLKDRRKEIGHGLLKAMCLQLGIRTDEL